MNEREDIELEPTRFFVLRTPLLPFEELEAWSEGLQAPGALRDERGAEEGSGASLEDAVAADRALLRERLCRLLERPEIREALFVASPAFHTGLGAWFRDPESKKGRRAEEALVRYFVRMASRPTPFGLFSGCSVGSAGERCRLRLAGRRDYRRQTRLDMDYLSAFAEDLVGSPGLRGSSRFRPSSTLYRAAGRLRFAEAHRVRLSRVHRLVAVDDSEFLEVALQKAGDGATIEELARVLVAADPDGEVTMEEAEEFVGELIDAQVLVPELALPVTGREPVEELAAQLGRHEAVAPAVEILARTREGLARLDAAGLGNDPREYLELAEGLRTLTSRMDLQRLFQVDLMKPMEEAGLGGEVLDEIERGVRILRRIADPDREDLLTTFRQQFSERYGAGRWVPLSEALDEEIGIGFGRSRGAAAEGSPLLEGLAFPGSPSEPVLSAGPWHGTLLRKVTAAAAAGEDEIEVSEEDLPPADPPLEGSGPPRMPDAFQVMALLAAPSEEALARGELRLHLRNAHGPSGARLLGRFCHLDEELLRHVEEHLRAEEALEPDAVFAEIVHLPEGRTGNVLWRPVLREYEIPFLGRSGAPPERQLPVSDLEVTVAGAEVLLRSVRLGRRVLPRLTSAHNFTRSTLGLYRFLGALQSQGVREGLFWNWGALDALDFLPRVASGRLVLCRPRWRSGAAELGPLAEAEGAERFRRVQAWRERRRLPRWTVLVDGDNELLVDLDNALSIDAFLATAARRPRVDLTELAPGPDELCVAGPEGRFLHELLIPRVLRREPSPRRVPAPPSRPVVRAFPPGSEWLYAKLYTGTSTADRVLVEALGPVVRQAVRSGAADRWFFLRYGDPDWHLRVRLHGNPRRLRDEVLPALEGAAAALLEDGRIWKLQLDTYEREVERYGGPEAIDLAERIFHADSDAALAILESFESAEGASARSRWRLALRGIHLLVDDLGFRGEARRALLARMHAASARELRADARLVGQLADRLRRDGKSLDALLDPEPALPEDHPEAPGLAALAERSRRLAPLAAEYHELERQGRLTVAGGELLLSFTHMFANRLLRSEGRAHEMVLYDFLDRLDLSREARARREGTRERS
jgi:lantibiotic biosynthesis protein